MTTEEKDLLLKDLCARLTYGFIVHRYSDDADVEINDINTFSHFLEYSEDEDFKPYLRPMSSMTEEEVEEFRLDFHYHFYIGHEYSLNNKDGSYMMPMFVMRDYFDWLNKKGFDYRGLIEKGLALEAPEGMYK